MIGIRFSQTPLPCAAGAGNMRGMSVDVVGLSVAPEAGSKANDQNSQNGAQPRHTTEFCNRI